MRNIAVAGTGYVGLSCGTCFADMGNQVTFIDISEEKIKMLQKGKVPIFEPGLSEMLVRNFKAGRISFTTDYAEALKDAEFVFICVGTPSGVDGEADLRYVRMAAESIAQNMTEPIVVVNKSTVPVGTGDWVADIIDRSQPELIPYDVVSCPEFTREGTAIHDFMNPDRVVLGSRNPDAAEKVAQLHLQLRTRIIITDLRTAEMIKYASNAFLATKISFINEIAMICEKLGADVEEVAVGMGYDKRIAASFLDAGIGYGGSCFPKDVKALEHMALVHGSHPSLLRAVIDINQSARRWAVFTLREMLGNRVAEKSIGILGLAFKPNTDDIREAPALDIARMLQNEGATVSGYDPVAMENVAKENSDLKMAKDPYELAKGADALLICTDWNEFKHLDLARIKESMNMPIIIDGRNMYDVDLMHRMGFIYRAVGKGQRDVEETYANGTSAEDAMAQPLKKKVAQQPSAETNSEERTENNGQEKAVQHREASSPTASQAPKPKTQRKAKANGSGAKKPTKQPA